MANLRDNGLEANMRTISEQTCQVLGDEDTNGSPHHHARNDIYQASELATSSDSNLPQRVYGNTNANAPGRYHFGDVINHYLPHKADPSHHVNSMPTIEPSKGLYAEELIAKLKVICPDLEITCPHKQSCFAVPGIFHEGKTDTESFETEQMPAIQHILLIEDPVEEGADQDPITEYFEEFCRVHIVCVNNTEDALSALKDPELPITAVLVWCTFYLEPRNYRKMRRLGLALVDFTNSGGVTVIGPPNIQTESWQEMGWNDFFSNVWHVPWKVSGHVMKHKKFVQSEKARYSVGEFDRLINSKMNIQPVHNLNEEDCLYYTVGTKSRNDRGSLCAPCALKQHGKGRFGWYGFHYSISQPDGIPLLLRMLGLSVSGELYPLAEAGRQPKPGGDLERQGTKPSIPRLLVIEDDSGDDDGKWGNRLFRLIEDKHWVQTIRVSRAQEALSELLSTDTPVTTVLLTCSWFYTALQHSKLKELGRTLTRFTKQGGSTVVVCPRADENNHDGGLNTLFPDIFGVRWKVQDRRDRIRYAEPFVRNSQARYVMNDEAPQQLFCSASDTIYLQAEETDLLYVPECRGTPRSTEEDRSFGPLGLAECGNGTLGWYGVDNNRGPDRSTANLEPLLSMLRIGTNPIKRSQDVSVAYLKDDFYYSEQCSPIEGILETPTKVFPLNFFRARWSSGVTKSSLPLHPVFSRADSLPQQ